MTIRYYINPDLNIILYVGEKIVTGSEYFQAAKTASQDKLRKWGMVTIIDVLSAEVDFELKDMRFAIDINDNLSEKGLEPEEVAVLSHSKGIRLIADTLKLLPSNSAIKLEVFNTVEDLISSLGFSEQKQEFLEFYNKHKLHNTRKVENLNLAKAN